MLATVADEPYAVWAGPAAEPYLACLFRLSGCEPKPVRFLKFPRQGSEVWRSQLWPMSRMQLGRGLLQSRSWIVLLAPKAFAEYRTSVQVESCRAVWSSTFCKTECARPLVRAASYFLGGK